MFQNTISKLKQIKAILMSEEKQKFTMPPDGRMSYSQCAEDLLIDFICTHLLKIFQPRYLEIGSHSPYVLNNTYYFYKRGQSGVCIEPNPDLWKNFSDARPRDTVLNIGVGVGEAQSLDFYIIQPNTLSTFRKEEAERISASGLNKIEKIISVQTLPINTILEKYFGGRAPNIVSLDTEGLDLDILKSWNFTKFRPEIFCIETLAYLPDRKEEKIQSIFELMDTYGYFCYADTYINSIFVDKKAWSDYRNGLRKSV